MEKILEKLNQKLSQLGLTTSITGKELMEHCHLDLNQISSYCYEKYQPLDSYCIETYTQYINELKKVIEFNDEVIWYRTEDDLDSEYATSTIDEQHDDYKYFLTHFSVSGSCEYFSDDFVHIINKIKMISKNEKIIISFVYLEDLYLTVELQNGEVVNVKNEGFDYFDEVSLRCLFYLLIVISYDVPLQETLDIIFK